MRCDAPPPERGRLTDARGEPLRDLDDDHEEHKAGDADIIVAGPGLGPGGTNRTAMTLQDDDNLRGALPERATLRPAPGNGRPAPPRPRPTRLVSPEDFLRLYEAERLRRVMDSIARSQS